MQDNDTTTRQITLHHLRHDTSLNISNESWTDALRNLWPSPFCAVLENTAEHGMAYAAAYINGEGDMAYCQADSPAEAVRVAREQFQAYIDSHPEEMPRRMMTPAKIELHSEGVDMLRHEHRWNRLMEHIGRHEDAAARRDAMGEFLDNAAPDLPTRARNRVIRRLEVVPGRTPRKPSNELQQRLAIAFDMFRMQMGVQS